MLQKMTEVSVLLLAKGTFATPLIETIRELEGQAKLKKAKKMQEMTTKLDMKLKPVHTLI